MTCFDFLNLITLNETKLHELGFNYIDSIKQRAKSSENNTDSVDKFCRKLNDAFKKLQEMDEKPLPEGYFKISCNVCCKQDELGDLYFYRCSDGEVIVDDILFGFYWELDDFDYVNKILSKYGYLPAKELAEINKINITVDSELIGWDSPVKRPYYRLRGKRVTDEQAFEVIRRTDSSLFGIRDDFNHKNYDCVPLLHFDNNWLNTIHGNTQTGWIRPSGIVGGNGITYKYPNLREIFYDIMEIKLNFPYLDFAAGITSVNEGVTSYDGKIFKTLDDYDDFTCVDLGVTALGNNISFLKPKDFFGVYNGFLGEDEAIFKTNYYESTGISALPDGYSKKCLMRYGLNETEAEKYIAEYRLFN